MTTQSGTTLQNSAKLLLSSTELTEILTIQDSYIKTLFR